MGNISRNKNFAQINKTDHEKNIINFIYISQGIALLDLRGCSLAERAEIKKAVELSGSILLCEKFCDFKKAVEGTIFEILTPQVNKEVTMILSRNEDELDSALENAFKICDFMIEHRIIRD